MSKPVTETRELGLRERKKKQTRERIAEQARKLFAKRGFDRVTISEVARAAEVSEQTVFNYFPTKEDLVYWRLESFEEEMQAAIRGRAPGESIVRAFGRYVLQRRGLLGDRRPEARTRLAEITRVITESPALLAREREIFDRYTSSLAALIAEETGAKPDDVRPWIVANALIGIHRALIYRSRVRICAGAPSARIARELRAECKRATAMLEDGFGSIDARG